MELSHLLKLVSELPPNSTLNYVRGTETCKFVNIDIEGQRINSEASNGESKSWAPSYLSELAPKIYENEPFNLSGLLNNRGSYRPVLETIIAHTREFYYVKKGTATALVWVPSRPKNKLGLEEISAKDIPPAMQHPKTVDAIIVNPKKADLSISELASELRRMYNSFESKTTGIHLFGIKYGYLLENKNLKEIISLAGLNDSYSQELNKMIRLYSAIKNNVDGVCFYEDVKNLLVPISVPSGSSKPNLSYLRAMRTKPFVLLAGISGTGKSRIVKEMAFDSCPENAELRKDHTSPGNYCLIEVKPNWHDSTELLGYESKINGAEYVVTPFVKFLAKAMLYENTPFFVCLDEMNLAPVEQYFAEFLSVLESRKEFEKHIVSEPLIRPEIFANKDYELKLQDDLFGLEIKDETSEDGSQRIISGKLSEKAQLAYDNLKKYGLRLPENVVVIGTVNMDETTHQFSRKVIDRAMTIEMNLPEGNPFMDFYSSRKLGYREAPETPFEASLYLPTKVSASEALEVLAENNAEQTDWLKKEIARILTELNSTLDNTPFKIAYRVQNELLLYFYEVWREDTNAEWEDILTDAVDQILMMKVLPRIEGDEELLEKPLERLINFCTPYPYAIKKVKDMQDRLESAHFTSFWP